MGDERLSEAVEGGERQKGSLKSYRSLGKIVSVKLLVVKKSCRGND